MSADFGRSSSAAHRAAFPERRCVVANEECSGDVVVLSNSAQLCCAHWKKWDDADWEGRTERLRAWVKSQRKGGAL